MADAVRGCVSSAIFILRGLDLDEMEFKDFGLRRIIDRVLPAFQGLLVVLKQGGCAYVFDSGFNVIQDGASRRNASDGRKVFLPGLEKNWKS